MTKIIVGNYQSNAVKMLVRLAEHNGNKIILRSMRSIMHTSVFLVHNWPLRYVANIASTTEHLESNKNIEGIQ